MASATDSTSDPERPLYPPWRGRWTLAYRILAVNLLAVLLLAFGILYLDAFRNQLTAERLERIAQQTASAANVLSLADADERPAVMAALAHPGRARMRIYGPDGGLISDSWTVTGPTYRLRDPAEQRWTKDAARALDRGFNALVGARAVEDFVEPEEDRVSSWPEAVAARDEGEIVTNSRNAPDLTPLWSAAAPLEGAQTLLLTINDRDFTRTVRSQRGSLAIALFVSLCLSIFLSLFLARTIVRPLRRIAIAAHRVRLGRAREVSVPRLPSRRDEIGMLARAISDMSQSLRHRIDNIEAFAADVTHELKNPLASLRSALDGIEKIKDEELRNRLIEVAKDDVVRLDRLIGDIGEAARTDAELARARFEPVDLGPLIEQLVSAWEERREKGDARLAFARPRRSSAMVLGDPGRLARAIDNIIDNAISFSPPAGLVEIAATRVGDTVLIRVDDEGPGVPPEARKAIFNRFHSVRPESETFGRHSGLGLAIASAIVEGHGGEIDVQDRDDAPSGARFTIRLPAGGQS